MLPGARPRIVAIGLAGGFLSGLLGVGGGVLIVPGLVLLLGMAQRRAHGTSLGAIILIGSAGAASFAARGAVNYALFVALSAGAVVGAPLGVRALAKMPDQALRILFSAAALVAGLRLLVSG